MTRSLRTELDATSELILDLASSEPPSWTGPLGPEQLKLAHDHGLLGLLATHPRVEFREPALAPYTRLAGRQRLMLKHLQRLLERLREASVPASVLKGPDLSLNFYADDRHRTFTDIDILIPRQHLAKALEVMESDPAVSSLPRKRPKADKRDIPVQDESGTWFMVDLHWDLFSYTQLLGCADGATEWAWMHSADEETDYGPSHRLPVEAYVAFLATHALLDHRFRLILFRDLAEVSRNGIDWGAFVEFVSRWRLRSFGYLALAMAGQLTGAPIPGGVLEELRPRSLPLRASEALLSRTDVVRFDGHRPHPLNLAMVLLHDRPADRLRLLVHAPPAVPGWMRRFGRPAKRSSPPNPSKKGRPPRVLVLVSSNQRRGAEVFGENLTAGLREHHWDADLVALSGEDDAPRVDADVVLTDKSPNDLGRLSLAAIRGLRKRIRAWEPDLILANGGSTLKYAAISLYGRKTRPHLICTSIGEPEYWIRNLRHRSFQRWLYQQAGLVLAVSKATRAQLIDYVGLHPERVEVAHTGVPGELTEIERRIRDGSLHVLFLGSLSPEKDPLTALNSVLRARNDQEMRIRFVGSGPLESDLRKTRGALVESDVIEFEGSVEDVKPHLQWADVLLLSSISEGLPGAVLEAAAAGVPAVAFDVGGTREAIIDGETGILVSPRDTKGLIEGLQHLGDDPEALDRMGRAARALAKERFLLGDTIPRYINVLERIIFPPKVRKQPEEISTE